MVLINLCPGQLNSLTVDLIHIGLIGIGCLDKVAVGVLIEAVGHVVIEGGLTAVLVIQEGIVSHIEAGSLENVRKHRCSFIRTGLTECTAKKVDYGIKDIVGEEIFTENVLKKRPQSVSGLKIKLHAAEVEHSLFGKSGKNIGYCLFDNVVEVFDGGVDVSFRELVGCCRPIVAFVVDGIVSPCGGLLCCINELIINTVEKLVEVELTVGRLIVGENVDQKTGKNVDILSAVCVSIGNRLTKVGGDNLNDVVDSLTGFNFSLILGRILGEQSVDNTGKSVDKLLGSRQSHKRDEELSGRSFKLGELVANIASVCRGVDVGSQRGVRRKGTEVEKVKVEGCAVAYKTAENGIEKCFEIKDVVECFFKVENDDSRKNRIDNLEKLEDRSDEVLNRNREVRGSLSVVALVHIHEVGDVRKLRQKNGYRRFKKTLVRAVTDKKRLNSVHKRTKRRILGCSKSCTASKLIRVGNRRQAHNIRIQIRTAVYISIELLLIYAGAVKTERFKDGNNCLGVAFVTLEGKLIHEGDVLAGKQEAEKRIERSDEVADKLDEVVKSLRCVGVLGEPAEAGFDTDVSPCHLGKLCLCRIVAHQLMVAGVVLEIVRISALMVGRLTVEPCSDLTVL